MNDENQRDQIKQLSQENTFLEDEIGTLASKIQDLIIEIAYEKTIQKSLNASNLSLSASLTNVSPNTNQSSLFNSQSLRSEITKLLLSFNESKVHALQQKHEEDMKNQLIKYRQLEDQFKQEQEINLKFKTKQKEYIKEVSLYLSQVEKVRNDLISQNRELINKNKSLTEKNEKIRSRKQELKKEIDKKNQMMNIQKEDFENIKNEFLESIENLKNEKQLLVKKIESTQNSDSSQSSSFSSPSKTSFYSQKLKMLNDSSDKNDDESPNNFKSFQYEEQINQLKNDLKTSNANNYKLSEKLKTNESHLNKLIEEKKKIEQKLAHVKDKNDQLGFLYNKNEVENQEMKIEMQKMKTEYDENMIKMKIELNNAIKKCSKIDEMVNQINKYQQSEDQLKKQLNETTTEIIQLKKIQDYFYEQSQELKIENAKTQEEMQKKHDEKYQKIKNRLLEALNENKTMQNKIKSQSQKLEEKREMISNLQKEKVNQEKYIDKIKIYLQKSSDSLKSADKEREKIQEENKSLQKKCTDLNSQYLKLENDFSKAKKKIEENEANQKKFNAEKEKLIKTISKLNEEKEKLMEEVSELNKANEANQKKFNTEKEKLIKTVSKLNEEKENLIEKVSELNETNETNQKKFNTEKEKLSKTVSKLNEEKENLMEEVSELKDKNQHMKQKIKNLKHNKKYHKFDSKEYLVDINDFKPVQETNNESQSTIQKVVNTKTSEICAIKTIKENNGNTDENKDELIKTLTQFQHSTIIDFLGFSKQDFSGNNSTSIIMKYAQNGSLQDILNKQCPQDFTNTSRQIIMIGVARSMMLFSKNKIFLGNLNPSKILLDENYYPHLTDFYESKLNNDHFELCLYSDPNLLNNSNLNEKSDVYSFALIMYEIITNTRLINQDQSFSKMIKSGQRPSIPENIKKSMNELIERSWSANPIERPSFEEIYYLLAYNKNYRLNNINEKEIEKYLKKVKNDLVFCNVCEQPINKKELVYYSGFPYHESCVECMKCHKKLDSSKQFNDNFVSITPGLFLCKEHYNEYEINQNLQQEISTEYNDALKKNITKELCDFPVFNNDNITEYPPDDIFIDSWMIQNSFQTNKEYNCFFPSVTFHFDKTPSEINFEKLKEILDNDLAIIDITKGSCFITLAIIMANEISTLIEEKFDINFDEIISPIKNKLKSAMGKSIVGNLVEEPKIENADEKESTETLNKKSINVLQNAQCVDEINLAEIKSEISKHLHNEIAYKNLELIFSNEELFEEAEKQVRKDIESNPHEMIIIGHTIIANKYFDQYNEIKSKIPKDDLIEKFLYHGTRLAYHQNIVRKHFLMPGQDKVKQRDAGYFGKGIYATENMFYASMYANGFHILKTNEKASIFCCRAIYNKKYVLELKDLSKNGSPIQEDIISNYGINHALVGSSNNYRPIEYPDPDKNSIIAEEFVFPTKFQIVPICSFIVMNTNFYILWKDENIDNDENKKYMEELGKKIEVNVYFKKELNEAVDLIKLKKRNKIKLITNGGENSTGKKLIEESRKIYRSNFVCLVFARDRNHLNWVTKMENVLFTIDPEYFKEFAAIDMEKKAVLNFAYELEKVYDIKFNINEDSLLKFT